MDEHKMKFTKIGSAALPSVDTHACLLMRFLKKQRKKQNVAQSFLVQQLFGGVVQIT